MKDYSTRYSRRSPLLLPVRNWLRFAYLLGFSSYKQIFRTKRYFAFQGETYQYFIHPYNTTWVNERAVEIPIVYHWILKIKPQDVLEVGNVLSHYFHITHIIIDKYESGKGIVMADTVDYNSKTFYKMIASISTIEHIGRDENPREPGKHRRAIAHIRELLADSGTFIATFPLGYNLEMDDDLANGRLGFDEYYFLKRVGREEWEETKYEDVRKSHYGSPFPAANALVIGIIRKGGPGLSNT